LFKKKSLQKKNKIVRKTSDHAKTTPTINRRLVTILSYLKGNFIDMYLAECEMMQNFDAGLPMRR